LRHDVASTTWQYDAAGNRDLETIGAGPAIDYVPNALNQYASIGGTPRSHDLNGNLTGDGTRTLGWDAESQLVSASVAGTAATYAYDPFGRRVRKTVDGSDTWFLWSGDRLLEERDDTGALAVRYTYGVGYAPVQVRIADGGSGEDVYDVHTDHLDTPRRLTDAAGAEVWVAAMAAFGEAFVDPDPDGDLDDVTFNTRFPGQYFDAETGLHYNRFRYYDPGVGRYISSDPIGQFGQLEAAGASLVSFAPGDPSNLDIRTGLATLYPYVGNSPVDAADPLGLKDLVFTQVRKARKKTEGKVPEAVTGFLKKVECFTIPGTDPDDDNPIEVEFEGPKSGPVESAPEAAQKPLFKNNARDAETEVDDKPTPAFDAKPKGPASTGSAIITIRF
jgi:RHS repeat-associated protein